MARPLLVPLTCLTLVLAPSHVGAYNWLQFPFETDEFNVRREYGTTVNLTCNDGRLPEPFVVDYWIRPDMSVMEGGQRETFWTLDGESAWTVTPDGTTLQVSLLTDRQFGFYYCVVRAGGQQYAAKRAINYAGPYFGNRWLRYRRNVIIGSGAAGAFLALALFVVFLTSWCESKHERRQSVPRDAPNGMSKSTEGIMVEEVRL